MKLSVVKMRAAFLGRFQPLHEGHHEVIAEYMEKYEDFLIIVGSADKERERENPLNFEERKEIIQSCFPNVEVVGLEDETKDEEGNRKWANKLGENTGADLIISQNDLVKRLVKDYTEMDIEAQKLYDKDVYSGTEIRRRIRSGEEWRYLVAECAADVIDEHLEKIKKSGIDYEFTPGWKRENAYHDTYEK